MRWECAQPGAEAEGVAWRRGEVGAPKASITSGMESKVGWAAATPLMTGASVIVVVAMSLADVDAKRQGMYGV